MRSGATMGSFILSILGTLLTLALEPMLQPEGELSREDCTAEKLMPLEARRKAMTILDGDRRGDEVELVLERVEGVSGGAGGERWRLTLGDLHEMEVSRSDAGDVMIHSLRLPEEGTEVVYHEPLTLLPAQCHVDGTRRERTTATVTDLEEGETMGRAQVDHAIHSVSIVELDLPAGHIRSFLTDIEQTLDMNAADITVRLESAYHPERGEVYRRQKTTIEKLGIFGETHARAVGLAEGEAERAAAGE